MNALLDHVDAIVAVTTVLFSAAVLWVGGKLVKRNALKQAISDYEQAYSAKMAECAQCRSTWEQRLEKVESEVADLREINRQALELNRYVISDRDALQKRVSELEVKVAILERELAQARQKE